MGTDAGFSPWHLQHLLPDRRHDLRADCQQSVAAVHPISERALLAGAGLIDGPCGVQGIYSLYLDQIDYNPGTVTSCRRWVATSTSRRSRGPPPVTPRGTGSDTESRPATPSVDTYALSYTPAALAAGSYRWTVQVPGRQHSATNGRVHVSLHHLRRRSPARPHAPDETTTRLPSLTWTPVTGADHYEIFIKRDFQSAYEYTGNWLTDTRFKYPAATDIATDHLAKGNWDWFVEAYDALHNPLGSSVDGHFKVGDLDTVSGWSVALDGNA